MPRFMNVLLAIDAKVNLVSFNGSRFDDLFIMWYLMDNQQWINCVPVNNGILSLQYKNIKCFDLSWYLAGSLAYNAQSFKCVN